MIILGGLIKKTGGEGVNAVPYFSQIPILGEYLFTHHSEVNREQNVVIYLTPYIVRKSGDLQKLKHLLSELENVQAQYNKVVEEVLDEEYIGEKRPESGSHPASQRIRRTQTNNLDLLDVTEEF